MRASTDAEGRSGRGGGTDARTTVANIQQQLREIQKVVRQQTQSEERVQRPKFGEALSEEFSDDNPYSRVMALQTLGVVKQYERIRGTSVAVVGCGGVGVLVCEILARVGVGILSIYDRDKVTLAHLSSMVFRPEHIGWSKTQVARHLLSDVNPDVHFRAFSYDVRTRYEDFVISLRRGSIDESACVDIVICCVDNRDARLLVNEACQELDVPCVDVSVSQTAMACTVTRLVPGETSCLLCEDADGASAAAATAAVVAGGDFLASGDDNLEEMIHASLPSTDCVAAGIAANMALGMLLGFGDESSGKVVIDMSTGASSPKPASTPNQDCASDACKKRQQAKTWAQ